MLRHVKFAHLPVLDQDRAIAFYRDRLGLSVAADEAYSEGWRWVELAAPGAATRILLTRKPDVADQTDTASDEPSMILVCDDVRATFRELAAKGVSFEREPAAAPWRPDELYALLRDSEGNLIMLDSA